MVRNEIVITIDAFPLLVFLTKNAMNPLFDMFR